MKTTAKSSAPRGTLTVTGEGQIKVRPDLAIIDMAVITMARTAQEAVRDNADKMTAVIAALKVIGLSGSDLQTVGFQVGPVFDRDEKSPTFGKILHYSAASQLRARVDVDQAGEVLDAAAEAGANAEGGLRFAARDEAAVRTRALKAAVKAARRDADTVADAMSIKIRGVQSVDIAMGGRPTFFRDALMAKSPTPIEPGTIDIEATVRVTFHTC